MGEPADPQVDEDAQVQRRRAAVQGAGAAEAATADAATADACATVGGVPGTGAAHAVWPAVDPGGGHAARTDRDAIIARWLRYARSEECHARLLRHEREQPFDQLRDTRAQVRRAAAELLAGYEDLEQAARAMMRRVQHLTVREPPLLQFDEAMLAYTQARTWQACALELSPELGPLQPVWA